MRVTKDIWWAREDSNLQPTDYESAALTIELRARKDSFSIQQTFFHHLDPFFLPKNMEKIIMARHPPFFTLKISRPRLEKLSSPEKETIASGGYPKMKGLLFLDTQNCSLGNGAKKE